MKDHNNSVSNVKRLVLPGIMVVAVAATLFFIGWTRTPETANTNNNATDRTKTTTTFHVTSSKKNFIQRGTTRNGIPYLHCSQPSSVIASSPSSPPSTEDLVLLHGARFTKEDWNESGVLEALCQTFSVTALDLDRTAGHVELKEALDDMKEEALIRALPVSIVTPSASGGTVVSWLSSDAAELKRYVHRWIPVAPPAVGSVDDATLEQLSSSAAAAGGGAITILAIYGNQDAMGKRVSESLGEHSHAIVEEIPGKHPCYLDSPDKFVTLVRDFLLSK